MSAHEQALSTAPGAPQAYYRVRQIGSGFLVDFTDAEGHVRLDQLALTASAAILAHHRPQEIRWPLCDAFARDFLLDEYALPESDLRIPVLAIDNWLQSREREIEIGAALKT